jgi:hypothetical protein
VTKGIAPPPDPQIAPLISAAAEDTKQNAVAIEHNVFNAGVLQALDYLGRCIGEGETKRSEELARVTADLLRNNVEAKAQSTQQIETADAKNAELTEVIVGLRAELAVAKQDCVKLNEDMLVIRQFVAMQAFPPVPAEEKRAVEPPLPLPGESDGSVTGALVSQEVVEATSMPSSVTPKTGDGEKGAEEKE